MQPTEERWLPVVGWEGRYEVSSLGRIRSLDRISVDANGLRARRFKGRLLRPEKNWAGYLRINLRSPERGSEPGFVHLLVLSAFVGPKPFDGAVCRHLNGVPGDNRVENLEWGTQSQNMRDTLDHGTNNYSNRGRCPHGHAYDFANTLWCVRGDGRRFRSCRACNRARKLNKNPSAP